MFLRRKLNLEGNSEMQEEVVSKHLENIWINLNKLWLLKTIFNNNDYFGKVKITAYTKKVGKHLS